LAYTDNSEQYTAENRQQGTGNRELLWKSFGLWLVP